MKDKLVSEGTFGMDDLDALRGLAAAVNRSQAMIEFDLDCRILTANENFLSLMGYEWSELKGQRHRFFCDPTYAQSLEYKDFWLRLRDGDFQTGEFKRLAKDGREVWIQGTYNPILDASGKVVKVVKLAADITHAKQRNAEFAAQMAAVNRSQAVIEFDTLGNILDANQNFLLVSGYGLKELVGQHHQIFCEEAFRKAPEYKEFGSGWGMAR